MQEQEEQGAEVLDQELTAIVESSDCPYLALAMQQVFMALPNQEPSKEQKGARKEQKGARKEQKGVKSPEVCVSLLPNSRVDLLLPLEPVLRRALAPTIQQHYQKACQTLVTLYMSELELEAVLSRARRVFFMEAGDLMHAFCSQLFSLTLAGREEEGVDSSSLTLLLQDCLSSRYPSWAEQFSVEYQAGENTGGGLEGLTLHLQVAWPLNLVLTRQNLATYSSVFLFLAGVKRSLWALQSIRLLRLREMEEQNDLDVSSLSLSSQDVSLPLGCKQHRLQLLRSWLLFFTTTVHGYFMSRVVHSTELELRGRLGAALDLDMIRQVHQEYLDRIHDRCFLHPSASMLREAVAMVLSLGLELQQAALSSLPIHTHTILAWEEKYSRCHNFLASTLQTMTARRKLPHLEGLTVALLHSCPSNV